MFSKFLQNNECMRVLTWLINHDGGEYSAAIIGIECDMMDMAGFMAVLSILEGVGFIKINEGAEELIIRFDKDSSISQLLIHLKDEFDDKAFRSEQVSPSLAYLYSNEVRDVVNKQLSDEFEVDENVFELCKNYKDLDLSDEKNKGIYDICSKLEESGEYEDFINTIEKMIEEKNEE